MMCVLSDVYIVVLTVSLQPGEAVSGDPLKRTDPSMMSGLSCSSCTRSLTMSVVALYPDLTAYQESLSSALPKSHQHQQRCGFNRTKYSDNQELPVAPAGALSSASEEAVAPPLGPLEVSTRGAGTPCSIQRTSGCSSAGLGVNQGAFSWEERILWSGGQRRESQGRGRNATSMFSSMMMSKRHIKGLKGTK